MFITAVQNVIRRELFRGSMHRGKYRYVRPVKLKDINIAREEMMRQERVMKLLVNPYLSKVIQSKIVCIQEMYIKNVERLSG